MRKTKNEVKKEPMSSVRSCAELSMQSAFALREEFFVAAATTATLVLNEPTTLEAVQLCSNSDPIAGNCRGRLFSPVKNWVVAKFTLLFTQSASPKARTLATDFWENLLETGRRRWRIGNGALATGSSTPPAAALCGCKKDCILDNWEAYTSAKIKQTQRRTPRYDGARDLKRKQRGGWEREKERTRAANRAQCIFIHSVSVSWDAIVGRSSVFIHSE